MPQTCLDEVARVLTHNFGTIPADDIDLVAALVRSGQLALGSVLVMISTARAFARPQAEFATFMALLGQWIAGRRSVPPRVALPSIN